MVSLHAKCLSGCFACLLTNVYDRKQGNQRWPLEGAHSWRLHRQQDQIRTVTCPKIQPNVRTNINFPHIEVTLHWFRNLLFFKTNHSVYLDKLQFLGIHLLDHFIFNCIDCYMFKNPTKWAEKHQFSTYIEVTLHLFRNLLFFKTNHSAYLDKL